MWEIRQVQALSLGAPHRPDEHNLNIHLWHSLLGTSHPGKSGTIASVVHSLEFCSPALTPRCCNRWCRRLKRYKTEWEWHHLHGLKQAKYHSVSSRGTFSAVFDMVSWLGRAEDIMFLHMLSQLCQDSSFNDFGFYWFIHYTCDRWHQWFSLLLEQPCRKGVKNTRTCGGFLD